MEKHALEKVLATGLVVLLVVLGFNAYTVLSLESQVSQKIEEAKELAKPAEVQLTLIEDACEECFSVSPVVQKLKEDTSLSITHEEVFQAGSEEAKSLVAKYKLDKLPALLVKGQLEKASLGAHFKQVEDALVFTGIQAPYVDPTTLEVQGLVKAVIIKDPSCEKCSDLASLISSFKQNGVVFSEEKTLDYTSEEASALIEKLSLESVPTLLLSKDALAYPSIAQALTQLKLEEKDGFFAFTGLSTPYVDIKTGKVVGLVKLTMLKDDSCTECYDVNVHKQVLTRFGMAIEEEKTLDISSAEGKALVEKYSIQSVPTIILTGDVDKYPSLTRVWSQVGTVEEDSSYIFRTINALGGGLKYMDLTTKTVAST